MKKVKKKKPKREKILKKRKNLHVVGLIFEMNNTKSFGERKETIKIKNKNTNLQQKIKTFERK